MNRSGSTYAGTVVKFPDDYDSEPWAPEVHKYNGMYYMFTTYRSKTTGKRGCTILRANHPLGPFEEITDGHITPADWFCIDGTFYVDNEGQPWMVFTHEEYMKDPDGDGIYTNIGEYAELYAAKLSEDLTHFISDPVYLFKGTDPSWAADNCGLADGPWLYTTEQGSLLMLWTNFDINGYSVGISRSESGLITGPWIHEDKTLSINKLIGDVDLPNGGQQGGGHPSTFRDTDGQLYLCIHTPNCHPGEEIVFIKICERNDTLVWDP